MTAVMQKVAPPSDDKRWKMIDATMRRYGHRPSALIETLHTVQECFGYIDDDALKFVAGSLGIPLSQAYGVTTFYHSFTLKPQGDHTCVVCTGTACHIKGAPLIIRAIEDEFGVKPGQTTADNRLSVLTARCIGTCGLSPAIVVDGKLAGKVTPVETVEKVKECLCHGRE